MLMTLAQHMEYCLYRLSSGLQEYGDVATLFGKLQTLAKQFSAHLEGRPAVAYYVDSAPTVSSSSGSSGKRKRSNVSTGATAAATAASTDTDSIVDLGTASKTQAASGGAARGTLTAVAGSGGADVHEKADKSADAKGMQSTIKKYQSAIRCYDCGVYAIYLISVCYLRRVSARTVYNVLCNEHIMLSSSFRLIVFVVHHLHPVIALLRVQNQQSQLQLNMLWPLLVLV
jgi:hypothetical protein